MRPPYIQNWSKEEAFVSLVQEIEVTDKHLLSPSSSRAVREESEPHTRRVL